MLAVEGIGMNAILTDSFSSNLGAVDVTELMARLTLTAEKVAAGTREGLEKMMAAQCIGLNAIFTALVLRAQANSQNLEVFERLIRIGLKAQSQSRATAESIALMQTPTVFAKQANIANGPQQVNNGLPAFAAVARADRFESRPIELLESHGERLDGGTASAAGTSRQDLATVGKVHRTAQRRG